MAHNSIKIEKIIIKNQYTKTIKLEYISRKSFPILLRSPYFIILIAFGYIQLFLIKSTERHKQMHLKKDKQIK
jgi:hypothetical protein